MNSEYLKPCPFCGSAGKLYSTEDFSLYCVECQSCAAEAATKVLEEDAIVAWNNRPADQDAARLRHLLKRYMALVIEEESISFLDNFCYNRAKQPSDTELAALKAIEAEIRREDGQS